MKSRVVASARSNFMKFPPVVIELERRAHETVLVHTGQHYDASMSQTLFNGLTDSDRLQKETPVQGITCITLREQTGRPMTIEQDTSRFLPWPLIVNGIVEAFEAALQQARRLLDRSGPEGWDGRAAERTVSALKMARAPQVAR